MKLTDGQVSGYEVLLLVDVRDVAASVLPSRRSPARDRGYLLRIRSASDFLFSEEQGEGERRRDFQVKGDKG